MVIQTTNSSENREQNYEDDIASVIQKELPKADFKDKQEFITEQELFLQKRANEYYLSMQIATLQRYQTNTKLRGKYARKIFCYLYFFSIICFVMIFLQGFHYKNFSLDTAAITTLIGGFAISVISLVKIILKGLFLSEEKTIFEQIKSQLTSLNNKDES